MAWAPSGANNSWTYDGPGLVINDAAARIANAFAFPGAMKRADVLGKYRGFDWNRILQERARRQ